jgi:glycosyltransferase involved in cell wall biosynthesis
MVLVEAMFNELPIVAFNKGGVADVIDEGETGYLVKSGNFKKFKKNLLKLMQNHELCESMRVKSLEKAEKDFTIEHMLDEYEQVFEGISK